MKNDLDQILNACADDLIHAWGNFDIWDTYESVTDPVTLTEMARFGVFFQFSRYAHFITCVIDLSRLCDEKNDSSHLKLLLNTAKNHIQDKLYSDLENFLNSEITNTYKKIKIIRHRSIAHRAKNKSRDDIYKEAALKRTDFSKLLENIALFINKIATSVAGLGQSFDPSTRAYTEYLLKLVTRNAPPQKLSPHYESLDF